MNFDRASAESTAQNRLGSQTIASAQQATHAENRRLHVDYHALARAAEAELAKAVAASSSTSETNRWVEATKRDTEALVMLLEDQQQQRTAFETAKERLQVCLAE
eukprot:COSAG05_NODE_2725_length_2724_cov_360.992762_2_plen_105_part_00